MKFILTFMICCLMGTPLQASYCYEHDKDDDLRGHDIAMRLKDPTGEDEEFLYNGRNHFFGVDGYFLENGLLYKRQLARYRRHDDFYPSWDTTQMNSASIQNGNIYVRGKRQVNVRVSWAIGKNKELRISTDAYDCHTFQLFQDAKHVALPTLCAGHMFLMKMVRYIGLIMMRIHMGTIAYRSCMRYTT